MRYSRVTDQICILERGCIDALVTFSLEGEPSDHSEGMGFEKRMNLVL